ncbi:homocitrate synthase [Anaeromicropila herbilytica]|uniref:Homocitrate synthase n=2 Tax=Anaeromicropila herbilytica TaxID=2785025 RepID=A0A7R7EPW5_9FIRM|nr:homocitrate synthase [Anaeromicropila herbilytica]
MIKIIDTTLTTIDNHLPSKDDLHNFCRLLDKVGVDAIEMSIPIYQRMEYLPEELRVKFYLRIEVQAEKLKYGGFYRYILHHADCEIGMISKIQINDIREIISLRTYKNLEEVCIVGLDDLLCYNYEQEMIEIKKALPKSQILFCPENTYGCASALAVQWVVSGGNQVMTSFAGHGNKAATEEVLLALRLAVRHKPNKELQDLKDLTHLYSKITGEVIAKKKPIIGEDIFKVEAGIHADGIVKNPVNYEPYDPKIVGGKTEIIIGKHSGKKAILLKCTEYQIRIPEEYMVDQILLKIQEVCTMERRSLSKEEFIQLVKEVCGYEN